MKAWAEGAIIRFEGTEEEWAVFLPLLKRRLRVEAERAASEFCDELWNGTSPAPEPKGLLEVAR